MRRYNSVSLESRRSFYEDKLTIANSSTVATHLGRLVQSPTNNTQGSRRKCWGFRSNNRGNWRRQGW